MIAFKDRSYLVYTPSNDGVERCIYRLDYYLKSRVDFGYYSIKYPYYPTINPLINEYVLWNIESNTIIAEKNGFRIIAARAAEIAAKV